MPPYILRALLNQLVRAGVVDLEGLPLNALMFQLAEADEDLAFRTGVEIAFYQAVMSGESESIAGYMSEVIGMEDTIAQSVAAMALRLFEVARECGGNAPDMFKALMEEEEAEAEVVAPLVDGCLSILYEVGIIAFGEEDDDEENDSEQN